MDELIAMLNVIKKLIKDGNLNVINCTIDKNKVDVLVSNFADVPTEKGTEYKLCDSSLNGLCYEKNTHIERRFDSHIWHEVGYGS